MRTYKVQSTDILVLAMGHDKASVPKDQDETLVFLMLPTPSHLPHLHNQPTSSEHDFSQELHPFLLLTYVLE